MAPTPRLQDLIEWLHEIIEPLQGQKWNITLNSDGAYVEATAKVTQSERDNSRGHRTTISTVTTARFRIAEHPFKRKAFTTD